MERERERVTGEKQDPANGGAEFVAGVASYWLDGRSQNTEEWKERHGKFSHFGSGFSSKYLKPLAHYIDLTVKTETFALCSILLYTISVKKNKKKKLGRSFIWKKKLSILHTLLSSIVKTREGGL